MEEYFNFLDNASVGKNYNWASLNIDLNFNKSEIDLDAILEKLKPFTGSTNEMLFIHEYVHYLQNFYCNWGAWVFCELVLALEKLGSSSSVEKISLELPLRIDNIENASIWNSGVYYYKNFATLLGSNSGNIEYIQPSSYPNLSIIKLEENNIIISNGRIKYTIDNRTIREHMAELSSCLFMNFSDYQIHEHFITSNSLCSSKRILDKNPMYWMLFEYFYDFKYKNIAEGLVLLCHAALCSSLPIKLLCRFFKFTIEHKDLINGNNDLHSLVKDMFLKIPTEIIDFSFLYNETLKKINDKIILCDKRKANDFYNFNLTIFSKLILNISDFYSAKLFFKDPFLLREKNNWLKIIKNTGTPIIRYKDKTPVISNYSKELTIALTYFFGVIKVLENLQDRYKVSCPFHTEFDICKVDYKNNDDCLHEPHLVKNPKQNGRECIYQNSLELLGLKDRLKFD